MPSSAFIIYVFVKSMFKLHNTFPRNSELIMIVHSLHFIKRKLSWKIFNYCSMIALYLRTVCLNLSATWRETNHSCCMISNTILLSYERTLSTECPYFNILIAEIIFKMFVCKSMFFISWSCWFILIQIFY